MKKTTIISIIFLTSVLLSCMGEEKRIIPEFELTQSMLNDLISDQNPAIRENISANPERFLKLVDFMLSLPEELLYLADKKHAVTRDQAPTNTVSPYDYGISVTRKERVVSSLIIESLKEMYDAAQEEGINIVFASGYRSFDYQEKLYNRYIEEMGQEEADRISARPGTSQHQLGTAVDFGSITDEYAETAEGKWLYAHAGDFGFSLSYPDGLEEITGYKWECWHYRYITVKGVELQNEFFSGVQQYLMEFWYHNKHILKEARG